MRTKLGEIFFCVDGGVHLVACSFATAVLVDC